MNEGVLAAFGAAMLYNLAIVVQKREAEKAHASGVRILGALAKRPIWLLGIALQIAGFVLHAFALAMGLSVSSTAPTWRDASFALVLLSGLYILLAAIAFANLSDTAVLRAAATRPRRQIF
mgnify:CR=1 FL=1